jgi:hypothetical protein
LIQLNFINLWSDRLEKTQFKPNWNYNNKLKQYFIDSWHNELEETQFEPNW